ncbi:hypothetical protein BCR36DRAFT_583588 [Piromyces finnis]|uniref:Golgi apparatus membrane protein TVP18 n=1 Tax=Piromyces finnis TaxID=1754191 RepID=A0A1Y1V8P4_9FUNG|nr:hypothetical protein BCR36DRAFT_375678 [Piromyces finnis]ORX49975.1 hypothetical protein BCR36DRAFT_583588 [Piromyces finnis]|eukprot:ORX37505.1 hypothetical protein BCR36DRAFT_375678 [Piromyces finnis]
MKFDFVKELTSGQCTIYGQWFAIISSILFLIFAPANILGILMLHAAESLQGILDLVFGCGIILLEIPIFLKCVPSSPKFDELIKFFEKNSMRAVLYAAIAVVNWLFEFNGALTAFILPTITITCSAISYGIATFKNEERVTSSLTGTSNLVDLASRV